jgi:hypothetical protein
MSLKIDDFIYTLLISKDNEAANKVSRRNQIWYQSLKIAPVDADVTNFA